MISQIFYYAEILADGTKTAAKQATLPFKNSKHRYQVLCNLVKRNPGLIVGLPAHELLESNKNIIWIDIDCPIEPLVESWTKDTLFPFTPGSFKVVKSSTLNHHIYLVVNRRIDPDEVFSFKDWLVNCTPFPINIAIDRIAGQNNADAIFMPGCREGLPLTGDQVVKDCTNFFSLPDLEGSEFSEWKKRNAKPLRLTRQR